MKRSALWLFVVTLTVGLGLQASAAVVGVWLLDENKGDTIKESAVGYKFDGKFLGGVKWDAAGKFGSAAKFDGVSGQIDIPDPDHILATKHITLCAYIKLDNVAGNHSILEQYDWAGTLGAHAFRTNGASLQCYAIQGTTAPVASGGSLKAGEWTHVAATYDGKTIRLYQDGKSVGEAAAAIGDLNPSNKSLSVGVRGDTKDVHWMAGLIDEVAVFDTALSEKELTDIAKNGLAAQYLAVSPKSKASVTWAEMKKARF